MIRRVEDLIGREGEERQNAEEALGLWCVCGTLAKCGVLSGVW